MRSSKTEIRLQTQQSITAGCNFSDILLMSQWMAIRRIGFCQDLKLEAWNEEVLYSVLFNSIPPDLPDYCGCRYKHKLLLLLRRLYVKLLKLVAFFAWAWACSSNHIIERKRIQSRIYITLGSWEGYASSSGSKPSTDHWRQRTAPTAWIYVSLTIKKRMSTTSRLVYAAATRRRNFVSPRTWKELSLSPQLTLPCLIFTFTAYAKSTPDLKIPCVIESRVHWLIRNSRTIIRHNQVNFLISNIYSYCYMHWIAPLDLYAASTILKLIWFSTASLPGSRANCTHHN